MAKTQENCPQPEFQVPPALAQNCNRVFGRRKAIPSLLWLKSRNLLPSICIGTGTAPLAPLEGPTQQVPGRRPKMPWDLTRILGQAQECSRGQPNSLNLNGKP